jgi:RNA polymerase sigma factor (sigma-70 family)
MKQTRYKRFHSNSRRKADGAACIHSCDCADWLRKNLSNPAHNKPTPEERKMLEERVVSGDLQAREDIFNRSLRSIFKIAGERAGGDPDLLMELFQEGALGASKALKNWKPGKGSFLTYANYYIEGAIHKQFQKNGNHSSQAKENNVNSGSADKEEREAASKDENSSNSSEQEFTQAGVTFDDIEEYEIADPGSNPEEEVTVARMTLEFIEVRDQLLECVRFYFSQINDIRLKRFSLMVLDHDGFLNCILPRLLGRKVKTSNYTKVYLKPCRKFLEDKYGEKVWHWSDSEVSRKLTNALNYICRRYLYDRILQDEKARLLIMRMKEFIEK